LSQGCAKDFAGNVGGRMCSIHAAEFGGVMTLGLQSLSSIRYNNDYRYH
jgi:hypothetical protein